MSPASRAICPFDATSTCIDFTLDGHWHVALGTGLYRDLGGGGTLHADGVAVNHATGADGYSDVYYNLSGQVGRHG